GSVAGTTTVSANTFTVTGTLAGAGGLTLNSGTTLAGTGTISKTITFNGSNRVAASPAIGPLTITTPVTWGAAGLQIYSGTVSTPGDTITGSLAVDGTLGGSGTAAIVAGTLSGTGTVAKPVTLGSGG